MLKSNPDDVKKFFDGSSDLMAIYLVDSDTYRTKAFRAARVEMEYVTELKSIISEQLTGFIEVQAPEVLLKNGVLLKIIQMLLGYTKLSTTELYAEVDEN